MEMHGWIAFALSATICHKRRLVVTVLMRMRRAVQPMASHDLDLISGDLEQSLLMNCMMHSSREIAGDR